jgi:hypothetical protein
VTVVNRGRHDRAGPAPDGPPMIVALGSGHVPYSVSGAVRLRRRWPA